MPGHSIHRVKAGNNNNSSSIGVVFGHQIPDAGIFLMFKLINIRDKH